jgi:hypothetical protein
LLCQLSYRGMLPKQLTYFIKNFGLFLALGT